MADALQQVDAALLGRIDDFDAAARELLSSQFFFAQQTGELLVCGRQNAN